MFLGILSHFNDMGAFLSFSMLRVFLSF